MTADPFWSNRFHTCALAAGFLAASEGRLDDSAYVRELAYAFYEAGAFKERAKPPPLPSEPGQAAQAIGESMPLALAEEACITAKPYRNNRKG